MSIATIKEAIKTNLDALVTDSVLAGATISDIKRNPLDENIAPFPHAIIMPPSMESGVLDNRTVLRTYTFDVMVLFQAEDLESTTQLEETIEDIVSKFDNDPTLGGTALGGILPISSAPEPFQHGGKDKIMVIIQIEAKEPVTLTFA
jgi:hypothetical protein